MGKGMESYLLRVDHEVMVHLVSKINVLVCFYKKRGLTYSRW